MVTPLLITGDCHVRTAVNKVLGYKCLKVSTQEDFFTYCRKNMKPPNVVIIDTHGTKEINPPLLVSWIKETYPGCLVIELYKAGKIPLPMQKLGHCLFSLSYEDAWTTDHLPQIISRFVHARDASVCESVHESYEPRDRKCADHAFLRTHLVGSSSVMEKVREQILLFAPQTHVPVHISGETGTGKEICADMLHHFSGLKGKILRVNSSSLRGNLVDAILFGKVRGAYTDAHCDSEGLIGESTGGTLFLDEIQELSLPTQAKLLRAQENHTYTKIGTTKEQVSHFRLISASCLSLAQLKDSRVLRPDYYYRLNHLNIHMPPLRERKDDIPELCRHYLEQAGETRHVSPKGMDILMSREWEGNIRELFSVLDRARILSSRQEILEISKESLDGNHAG